MKTYLAPSRRACFVICALSMLALPTGCAFHRTTELTFDPDTKTHDKVTFTGFSLFNRTAVTALKVGTRSSKESSTLSLGTGSTETQAEAITAAGEALGAGIAAGVRKSIVP